MTDERNRPGPAGKRGDRNDRSRDDRRGPRKDDRKGGRPPRRPRRERPEGESAEEGRERLALSAQERLEELESRMPGLAARRAALDLLALMRKGRTLDEALDQTRSFSVLDGPDRAFARNIVSTSWRRRGSIDGVIGTWLDRPLPAKNIEVMDILRITAVQLLLLKTPPHAAVATATELAGQKQETRPFAKLVNAISRRISDKGAEKLEAQPARVDTPGWLWRALERVHGPQRVEKIAAAHRNAAPLDLTLKPNTDAAALNELDGALSLLPSHVRLSAAHDVAALPGFGEGQWWVQDIAASIPVRLLGDVAGKTVIDLCAAPGGKTLQFASGGATVTAVDISGFRLKRLEENLERTGLAAETVKADVMTWQPENKAEIVLLDAPCSATGTIRRNPDVAWTKSEEDVAKLVDLQSRMIDRALEFVAPGGVLVYCVCSLLRREGEDQLKAALARHDGLELVPAPPEALPGLEGVIAKDGTVRTTPAREASRGGMDGFFVAMMRKPS